MKKIAKNLSSIIYLIGHNCKCEFNSKERVISSLLFASTILIIFNFVFVGKISTQYAYEIFIAEVFVTLLLTMQLNLLRLFDIECEDNALESLRLSPVSSYAIYMGKYLVNILVSLLIVIPSLLLAFFFHKSALNSFEINGQFFSIFVLVVFGVSSIGCLIAALLQKINAREALYPLLFYPLTIPLLIVGMQASYKSLITPGGWEFVEILLGLDFLYFLLSLLLFDELMT